MLKIEEIPEFFRNSKEKRNCAYECGELAEGNRSYGGPILRYRDTVKRVVLLATSTLTTENDNLVTGGTVGRNVTHDTPISEAQRRRGHHSKAYPLEKKTHTIERRVPSPVTTAEGAALPPLDLSVTQYIALGPDLCTYGIFSLY